jgi:hypothetical protein
MTRKWSAWFSVLLLCCTAARAHAEPVAPKLRAVLHVQSELERSLIERVRGQLSDVPVDLIVVDDTAPSREPSVRTSHVQRLTSAHAADVALWFSSERAQLRLFLVEPRRDPVLVRTLAGTGSGIWEAAALVVRSALLARADALGTRSAAQSGVAAYAEPDASARRTMDPNAPRADARSDESSEQRAPGARVSAQTSIPARVAAEADSVAKHAAHRTPDGRRSAYVPSARDANESDSVAKQAARRAPDSRAPAQAASPARDVDAAERGAEHAARGPLDARALPARDTADAAGESQRAEWPESQERVAEQAAERRGPDSRAPAHAAFPTRDAAAAEGGAPHPSSSSTNLSLLAGWQGVADGSAPAGQHGFALRGALSFGLLELGLTLSMSPPVTRSDALAELAIARHAGLASAGLAAASGTLRFSAGVHAGAALYQRSTTARSDAVAPERARFSAAALFGPWLGFAYMPGGLGVGAQLGLDVVPGPPSFVYRYSDGQQLAHRPWALQLRASVGIQGELR